MFSDAKNNCFGEKYGVSEHNGCPKTWDSYGTPGSLVSQFSILNNGEQLNRRKLSMYVVISIIGQYNDHDKFYTEPWVTH